MAEIIRRTAENRPPKSWHDKIREKFPGTLFDPDWFESFTIRDPSGLEFIMVSITKSDPRFKASEGIYIETNVSRSFRDGVPESMDQLFLQLTLLFQNDTPSEERFDAPKSLQDNFKERVFIDPLKGIAVKRFALTEQGTLVFSLSPAGREIAQPYLDNFLQNPDSGRLVTPEWPSPIPPTEE